MERNGGFPCKPRPGSLSRSGRSPDGRELRLSPEAAQAWVRMKDAALSAGITVVALSGFRSVERQEAIIAAKVAAGQSLDDILKTVAAPGFSEHHTGRAVDCRVPRDSHSDRGFCTHPGIRLALAHAHEYGFKQSYPKGNAHGIAYEPWHWCFEKPT